MSKHDRNSEALARCASCGVSRNRGTRCAYCGAVYTDGLDAKLSGISPYALDRKYKVKQNGRDIEITWNWRHPILWLLVPLCLFWNMNILLVLSLSDVFSNAEALFAMSVHLVIAVGSLLAIAFWCFNTTAIKANSSSLSLSYQPIAWRAATRFDTSDVSDVRVTSRKRTRNSYEWDVPVLQVFTTDGRKHNLLAGSSEADFSDYEALQRHLSTALDLEYN